MNTVILKRARTGDMGTFGSLSFCGQELATAELPWRDNQSNLSCIPAGEYVCIPYVSKRFGAVYLVQDVPGRSYILFHAGNYAGNSEKGYKTDSHGCILLGMKHGSLSGQDVVLSSKVAMAKFREAMGEDPFTLKVEEVDNGIA